MKLKTVSMLMVAGSAGLAAGPVSANALDDLVAQLCQVTTCRDSAYEQGGVGIVPDPTKIAKWAGADVQRINSFKLFTGGNEEEYALMVVKLNGVRSDSPTVACTQSAQPYESYYMMLPQ